jgi:hypothetical protein
MFTGKPIDARLPPMMSVSAELPSAPRSRATGPLQVMRDAKILRTELFVWIYCNPLKFHKTAKTFFGKAWHWNHRYLEIFAKYLEAGRPCLRLDGVWMAAVIAPPTRRSCARSAKARCSKTRCRGRRGRTAGAVPNTAWSRRLRAARSSGPRSPRARAHRRRIEN